MFISLFIEGRHWPWYTKRSKETKTHKCSGIERKVATKTTDGLGDITRKEKKSEEANDKDEYRNRGKR